MAFPFVRAVPILRGISELSGEDFDQYVSGTELVAWLEARGETWNADGFSRAIWRLKDGGWVRGSVQNAGGAAPGYNVDMLELDSRGAEAVEGWPSSGSVDAVALASAIVTALAAQAEEPGAPEEVKSLAKRLAEGAAATAFNGAVAYGMKQAGIG